jgi:hypothetical protein
MTVMNAIAAKQLKVFKAEVDALIEKGLKKDEAIFNVLREYIKQLKNILFEGDGYSDAWEKEAKKRGLSNHKTTPTALKAKVSKKALDLFKDLNVMNHVEVEARYEIELEEYTKKIQIEGKLTDCSSKKLHPPVILDKILKFLPERVRTRVGGDKKFEVGIVLAKHTANRRSQPGISAIDAEHHRQRRPLRCWCFALWYGCNSAHICNQASGIRSRVSLSLVPNQRCGATTTFSSSAHSHAPHQLNELLAITNRLHALINRRSSCASCVP